MKRIMKYALVAIALCSCLAFAQSAPKASASESSEAAEKAEKDRMASSGSFQLDFAISENENGKLINQRHYMMKISGDGSANEIKIGTRVPITTGPGQGTYTDVGTNLQAFIRGDTLTANAELSSLAPTEKDSGASPMVRQLKLTGRTPVVIGKPILVGSADDPYSKRQFQVEVTITKIR